MKTYLIVGGVAGGATTAARLRRNDEHARIIMFEKGEYISYANCGLPYYLGGTITERDKLFVQTPETFHATLNIEVRNLSEVIDIDRTGKRIQVKKVTSGDTYWEHYDTLVLSPGAEPVRPPITGLESPGIFTLRNVSDTDRIKNFIETNQPKKAIVIGAGFIGLEMAENLHQKGMQVTIVEMASQVMIMLDYEIAAEVHQHFKVKGVECYLGDGVQSIRPASADTKSIGINLNSGRHLEADLIILSIGVRPDSGLAVKAGITTGTTKGIVVNDYLQTSDPNIYAVGDAIEFKSPITGKPTITYLAGPANKQGRICADNISFGNISKYRGAIGTAVAKVFDLTVASTGASEKLLKREGIAFHSCVTHGSSHAGYYPGALAMTLKLLFAPDGRVLGAQGVGYEGVDKRIDMIAVLIQKNGTIDDLTEIEHAYAPPYSSAKDPVNILGFVAQNIRAGTSTHIRWDELATAVTAGAFLLDVRLPDEFGLGTIPGAISIPLAQLRSRLQELPRDRKIIVFCGVGLRAYLAERILKQNGFDVANLSGGLKTWEYATMKQSNEDIFEKDHIAKDDTIYQVDPNSPPQQRATQGLPPYIKVLEVDACGLQCPGPILKLKTEMDRLLPGQRLKEIASDPGFMKDVAAWCRMTGNTLIELTENHGKITAIIEKGNTQVSSPMSQGQINNLGSDTTLIVFSDDMDKALASLVIANGAASAGKKVTIFFTFWGLNVIKKTKKPAVKKDFMGKMFGMMMPSSLHKLALSKMHMAGMGSFMMKKRMANLRIDSLQTMLDNAVKSGVRMVACNMSMEVMGVKIEELIDGVEDGGVATMLEAADSSRATFFI